MKNSILFVIILLCSNLLDFSMSCAQALDANVKVIEVRSGNGKILLSVFKNSRSFDDELPYKNFVFDKKSLVNGSVTITCKLEPGTYGFTLVDDENDNGKLDKNMIGIPKEGFGFSNFFLEKLQKPAFDEFDLNSNQTRINIKVKYL